MINNKGITLMALVITIIVMIIIAGVTISVTLGENGLVNKSQSEAAKYEAEANRKSVNLAVLSAARAGNGTVTEENLTKYLNEQIGDGKYTLTSEPEGFKITIGTLEFTTTLKGVVTEKVD
ncbi:MAG: hypothetical protein J6M60_00730 [Clostridia bacterium]|nr:hypothetical protein [Clostridia bacterium]